MTQSKKRCFFPIYYGKANLIEALKKLNSALEIIRRDPDGMDSCYEEYEFLLKVQEHLKNDEIIESPDKLKPILGMIDEFKKRTVKNEVKCRVSVKIKPYLEYVEKKLIDVETGN